MGEQFGKYRLDRLLGRGGMGAVWLARDTDTGRTVALKVLAERVAADAEYRQRFEREARLGSSLRHPNIVQIHGFGELDGRLFIDMEYIDGIDLAEMLTRVGTLTPTAAADFVTQVASGLDAAHRAGLIHRDVKPSNILIGTGGHAYLIDFGIAQSLGQTSVTATGMAIGSWAYMAPERFNGTVDARSDVYSLACVLYECLTGRRPYGDTDPARQMHGHLMTAPPNASTVNPAVPAEMDAIIARGMAKDQAARYRTAREFAAAAYAAAQPKTAHPPQAYAHMQAAAPQQLAGHQPSPTRVQTRAPMSSAASAVPLVESSPKPRAATKVLPEPGPTPTLVATRLDPAPPFVSVESAAPQQNSPWSPNRAVVPPGSLVRPPSAAGRVVPQPKRAARIPVAPRWTVSQRRPWLVPPARRAARRRPRRKSFLSRVIGALVVMFLTPFMLAAGCAALVAFGNTGSGGGPRTADPSVAVRDGDTAQSAEPPAPVFSGLNTPVRDGKFEFVVTAVDSGIPRIGLQNAGGTYSVVTVAVRNISDEPKWFLPVGQRLVDTQGRQVDHNAIASMWQNTQRRYNYSFELQPGQSATTQLVFDVPQDATPSQLELHDFLLSNGVTVHLN
ncbi:protein kinase domain-containing protein [Nocardia sp. CA-129566]|uniref:serine/threonine-protein kinase n=1 Tax=Nocardia sp. CA-129566 TaxID=3239976 RepID=UPI003D967C58